MTHYDRGVRIRTSATFENRGCRNYLKVSCMSLTEYKDTALEWHGQESSFFLCPELRSYDLLENWVDKTYCILGWKAVHSSPPESLN